MADVKFGKLLKSILACASGALVVGAIYYLFSKIDAVLEPVEWDEVDQSLFISTLVGIGTFAGLAAIGLPVQWYLQRSGRVGIFWHIVPATLAGAALALLILLVARPDGGTSSWLLSGTTLIGFIASAVAWLIRRPDKDATAKP